MNSQIENLIKLRDELSAIINKASQDLRNIQKTLRELHHARAGVKPGDIVRHAKTGELATVAEVGGRVENDGKPGLMIHRHTSKGKPRKNAQWPILWLSSEWKHMGEP